MQPTPRDARQSFRDAPLRRLYCEAYCLVLTFVFHASNNHGRKLATIAVVGVWAAIEVGAAYGVATLPEQFLLLRLVVGVVVGRMWGIEVNNFAGVKFTHLNGEGDENGND